MHGFHHIWLVFLSVIRSGMMKNDEKPGSCLLEAILRSTVSQTRNKIRHRTVRHGRWMSSERFSSTNVLKRSLQLGAFTFRGSVDVRIGILLIKGLKCSCHLLQYEKFVCWRLHTDSSRLVVLLDPPLPQQATTNM